jgi:hypothetical protein
MVDEKDRFGDKLRQKQKGDEERFFAERDKAALEKLRKEKEAVQEAQVRELALMRCPKDGDRLASVEDHGVTFERCPTCSGMWLDQGELEQLATRDKDSWLGRLFYRPKL